MMVRLLTVVLVLLFLAEPGKLVAQQVLTSGAATVTLRGFVSGTLFAQDADFGFGNGQSALWVALADPGIDGWIVSGDVRATRLGLDIAAPEELGGWSLGGTVELDFFGGPVSSSHPVGGQLTPRLRLAFTELSRGRTILRIGQDWSPSSGYVPASLSHIAYPLGFGSAGVIGWHYPGISVIRHLTGSEAATVIHLQLAAFRGSWGPQSDEAREDRDPGEAGVPQLEARINFDGRTRGGMPLGAYVVGHVDRKDFAVPGAVVSDELTGTAIGAGARLATGPFTLHGGGYHGRAIGQIAGNLLQFGDIVGWGAWGQAGIGISPWLSGWLFFGIDDPDDSDVAREVPGNGRLRNRKVSAMLRASEGPFGLGLEWLNATTDWRLVSGATASEVQRTGNQIAVSVLFTF